MTPWQLGVLATEHRYATDPKARRPSAEDNAGFLLGLAAAARRTRGR